MTLEQEIAFDLSHNLEADHTTGIDSLLESLNFYQLKP